MLKKYLILSSLECFNEHKGRKGGRERSREGGREDGHLEGQVKTFSGPQLQEYLHIPLVQ